MLPWPGALFCSFSSPERSREISRLMARPRPVPPYLRAVPPIACWKASKMICCLSPGMPIPVSVTANPMTARARPRVGCSGLHPDMAGKMRRVTEPASVNLKALASRFLSTCCSRLASVCMPRGRPGSTSMVNCRFRDSATWRKLRSTYSVMSWKLTSPTSTDTVPDSIFERSRMSLMRVSRSWPELWMVRANSICRGDRLPSGFSASWLARMSRLLSGVRSSWDMLARNSDLYLEVSASCSAFSSRARRACSTSLFLRSTSWFWSASRRAFSSSSSLVCCSSSCWLCSSRARPWDCSSSSSVRVLASMVLSTIPIDSVSCSRNARWVVLNRSKEASSITALTSPSNTMGSTMMLSGVASPSPELIGM